MFNLYHHFVFALVYQLMVAPAMVSSVTVAAYTELCGNAGCSEKNAEDHPAAQHPVVLDDIPVREAPSPPQSVDVGLQDIDCSAHAPKLDGVYTSSSIEYNPGADPLAQPTKGATSGLRYDAHNRSSSAQRRTSGSQWICKMLPVLLMLQGPPAAAGHAQGQSTSPFALSDSVCHKKSLLGESQNLAVASICTTFTGTESMMGDFKKELAECRTRAYYPTGTEPPPPGKLNITV